MTSSPSKQKHQLEASEMVFSSPSKSMIMSTPRGNGASPWRIKVTVQAEPEDDGENAESPSVKRVTRTKTTTVPLKDHDASSPVKRPRGRPRKADLGATPKSKRKGTPIKRPAQSSPTKSARGGDSSAADVDTDVPPRKKRGRPRKNVQPATEDDETLVVEHPETLQDPTREETPQSTASSASGDSQKSARFADPSNRDLRTIDDVLRTSPTESEGSPSIGTPAQESLRNSLRARRGTPHAKKVSIIESEEEDEGSDVLTPTSGEEDNHLLQDSQHLSLPEGDQEDMLTPSETSAQSSDSDDDGSNANHDAAQDTQEYEDDETQGQQYAFDEGTFKMGDDTAALDSMTFSMISVDSLPSNAQRSSPPRHADTQSTTAPKAGSLLRHEYLNPSVTAPSDPEPLAREEQTSSTQAPTTNALARPARPKLSRHITPAIDTEVPSVPPALQPTQPVLTKSPSPTLGRAVTAGVALQGLLDPNRLTPEPAHRAPSAKRDSLDDLFRGFSEGTRKDLQAGLRLGEQLAQDQTKEDSAPGPSSPIKGRTTAAPKQGVFRTQRKYRQSRLLTPEDQDHVITAAKPAVAAGDVQYPALNVEELEEAPPSPARSESAMSWRADTPPRVNASRTQHDMNMGSAQEEKDTEKPAQHEDYGDIWQEEASRSFNSADPEEAPAAKSSEVIDLFTDASVVRPARGKLPRTWRRKKTSDSRHGNEVESAQEPEPEHVQDEPETTPQAADNDQVDEANSPQSEVRSIQEGESGAGGEESDDAGMFFQSNIPNVFNQKRPSRFENRRQGRQEKEKVSLSELLDQGESFVPESSPPMVTKKTSPPTKGNPFLDTPPRFAALMSSPKKSSPLRRELHSGDISTSSVQQFEESTLPIAQSSPFRTIVDGDSKISAASDQQQFRMEMEGNTASTIIRVREEANEYLDAYEPQERSLNEITEVTEPSRTHQDRSLLPSSPPKMQQRFEQRLLSARKPSPLSKAVERSPIPQTRQDSAHHQNLQVVDSSPDISVSEESETSHKAGDRPTTRHDLTASVKSAPPCPFPPAPHPILSRLNPLPKIEPWTRTHYKALDKLYTTHLKHPALFCPSNVPPTPLSSTNGYLLRRFLAANGNLPYVGATFHAWDYSMLMTAELVVMCSVFVELMSLESEEEYEQVTGKRLQVGDCAPGRVGDLITGEEVMRRLATVVMGESVRRDERAGRAIDRSQGLQVEWPRRRR
ncbi:hypothetical protein DDE83_000098 [Stemphylium lycopersici]|uniref:Uncharacterized protein n=1 Tax=Stemphylium lycopersici TaxID=183478 RepID=A0A364NHF7_STELY|nr:hypothetical protein DDE83_000098 [Stemphylium lycopersici]